MLEIFTRAAIKHELMIKYAFCAYPACISSYLNNSKQTAAKGLPESRRATGFFNAWQPLRQSFR